MGRGKMSAAGDVPLLSQADIRRAIEGKSGIIDDQSLTFEDVRALLQFLDEIGHAAWRPIDDAPRDGTHILLLTGDFGVVEGFWSDAAENFYKSQKGWASYDPENTTGDWVSYWTIGDKDDHRLYCGATPRYWMPVSIVPADILDPFGLNDAEEQADG